MKKYLPAMAVALVATLLHAAPAFSQTVKITPLGSHDGEFCGRDRAMLLEDPNGTTFLFDVGRTVAGAGDPRLGKVDVVLLSSVHGDHLGDRRIEKVNDGTCGKPKTGVKTAPQSNTAQIAAGKNSKVMVGGHMHSFLKAKEAGGDPKQVQILRFGAKRMVNGIRVATIPAVHANGISPAFLNPATAGMLKPDGLSAYSGPDSGFVLTFTNGLTVYLSADTGHTSDMDTLVRR